MDTEKKETKKKICGNCYFHRNDKGHWICTNYCGKYHEYTNYNDTCENIYLKK